MRRDSQILSSRRKHLNTWDNLKEEAEEGIEDFVSFMVTGALIIFTVFFVLVPGLKLLIDIVKYYLHSD